MKTLVVVGIFSLALAAPGAKAQSARPDWSVNLHFSPYLFEGQIHNEIGIADYSYNTFLGADFTRKISRYFDASLSVGYTKAHAEFSPVVYRFISASSSIPPESFLTESYNVYLNLRFVPVTLGRFSPFISAGFGADYFSHEAKGYYDQYTSTSISIYDNGYVSQHELVPFIPVEAGILLNLYRTGEFNLALNAEVLTMYSLRQNVSFDGVGQMSQPISTGILTGISVGW